MPHPTEKPLAERAAIAAQAAYSVCRSIDNYGGNDHIRTLAAAVTDLARIVEDLLRSEQAPS